MSGVEKLLFDLTEARFTVVVRRCLTGQWAVTAIDQTKKRKPASALSKGRDLTDCLLDVSRITQPANNSSK